MLQGVREGVRVGEDPAGLVSVTQPCRYVQHTHPGGHPVDPDLPEHLCVQTSMSDITQTEVKSPEEPVLTGGRGPKKALLVPEPPARYYRPRGHERWGQFGPLPPS